MNTTQSVGQLINRNRSATRLLLDSLPDTFDEDLTMVMEQEERVRASTDSMLVRPAAKPRFSLRKLLGLEDDYAPFILGEDTQRDSGPQTAFRLDDCPSAINWQLSNFEKLVAHLNILRDDVNANPRFIIEKFGEGKFLMKPEMVLAHAQANYGNLVENLRSLLLTNYAPNIACIWEIGKPGAIDWANADRLLAKGYIVTFDKFTGKLAVALGDYSIVIWG
jgi:hypothetical protein